MNRRLFLITTGIVAVTAGIQGSKKPYCTAYSKQNNPLHILVRHSIRPTARPKSAAIEFVAMESQPSDQIIL